MQSFWGLKWLVFVGLVAWCASGSVAWAGLYTNVVVNDQPVSYWRLGETSGTTAADLIGLNPGQYLNGVTLGRPGALAGDPDTAAYFDGSDDKVDVPWSASLNPASFSFECWAKVATGSGTGHRSPVTSRNNSPQEGYIFYAEGGRWQFWTGPGWSVLLGPANSVVEDQWAYLVGTYDAATKEKRLYINGQLAATATGVTVNPNSARPLRIGGGATEGAGAYFFRGDIDEVAVYNYVLSPGQIARHYGVAVTGLWPWADGPIYHFDEGSGTTAYDASGYHANGALYNGPTWTTGKYGGALQFDGVDDYVHVSSFPSGQYSQLTVEAWIYPLDKEGKQGLISEQNGDTLWMNFDTNGQDKLDIYLGDTTNKGYHSSNTAISRNTWTHVAFTYNDQTDELKLYINGQLDRTITTSGLLNFDSGVRIGRPEYNNEPFKGLIDEIAFYFRSLSAQEIYARYLEGPPTPVPEPASGLLLVVGMSALVGLGACRRKRGLAPILGNHSNGR